MSFILSMISFIGWPIVVLAEMQVGVHLVVENPLPNFENVIALLQRHRKMVITTDASCSLTVTTNCRCGSFVWPRSEHQRKSRTLCHHSRLLVLSFLLMSHNQYYWPITTEGVCSGWSQLHWHHARGGRPRLLFWRRIRIVRLLIFSYTTAVRVRFWCPGLY